MKQLLFVSLFAEIDVNFKDNTVHVVKSLNQKIVTGGDKLGLPLYNCLTMHPNQF